MPLPTDLSRARRDGVSGGWTGFWIAVWGTCVAVPAAAAAALLLTVEPALRFAALHLESAALEERVPPDELLAPFGVIADGAAALAVPSWPWALALAAVAALTAAAGVALARGSDAARRVARCLLAALACVAVGGGAHLCLAVLPRHALRAEALRAALHELAIATGETVGGDVLDLAAGGSWATQGVAWAAAGVLVPSLLLWFAAGRAGLRTWCRLPLAG